MSAEEEFRIFWKHYGVSYAEKGHVEEAMRAFVLVVERQLALAVKEELFDV